MTKLSIYIVYISFEIAVLILNEDVSFCCIYHGIIPLFFFLCGLTPNKVKQFRKIYIKNYLFIIIPVSLNSYNCRFNFPGAVHHDDLIYVAYISKLFPFFDETYPEAKMVTKLTTIYANFAKTG